MSDDKEKQKHSRILAMPVPKNKDQCFNQAKAVTEHFYDAAYADEGNHIAIALIIDWLLTNGGVIHELTDRVARDTGMHKKEVGAIMCTTIGLIAREKEKEWLAAHTDEENPIIDITKEFIIKNSEKLSFLVLIYMHERAGLGCGCGLCVAVHFAAAFNGYNTQQVLEEIIAIGAKRDKKKCCSTLLKEVAKMFNWKQGKMRMEVNPGDEEDESYGHGRF